ncbi:hypothetical protein FIBSPDRAFT_946337 [Athelia psychrophila]|uniref:Uncharacterized protein n=1 Tax=Athelia psychrophila TaxID=1759441 RepID=A0A166STT2_9AGAM|nr:hypothetical protein FIBSPDRAFT_946337 [Fibularhizoctonia sp. CBS 109695]
MKLSGDADLSQGLILKSSKKHSNVTSWMADNEHENENNDGDCTSYQSSATLSSTVNAPAHIKTKCAYEEVDSDFDADEVDTPETVTGSPGPKCARVV